MNQSFDTFDTFDSYSADACEIPTHSGERVRPETVLAHFYTLPAQAKVETNRHFADFTTIGTGGPIKKLIWAGSESEIVEAFREADAKGEPIMMLGGGSNLLVGDAGFNGTVVRDLRNQLEVVSGPGCGGVVVRVPAGRSWDDFICEAIENDWMGLESLSGIPGTVGAAPVQNVGAYGHEVAEFISVVKVYDRAKQQVRRLPVGDLQLGYRDSVIKRSLRDPKAGGGRAWSYTGRFVVLEVDWQLRFASLSAPIKYSQLATALGVELESRVDIAELRQAVLELRRSKGMVLDSSDSDTYSCGSFFTNPIVSEAVAKNLPASAPRFPVHNTALTDPNTWKSPVVGGVVKTSAAWLINHSGVMPGYSLAEPSDKSESAARVSSKHVLALTNPNRGSAKAVLQLANKIISKVQTKYGITLEMEPVAI